MSQNPLKIVIALGGNAICPPGQAGNIPQQFDQTRITCKYLADLIDRGHRLLITHGNGPQVGNILRRVEIASQEVYPIDLGLCVADTQAGMGYMISQCLINEFHRRDQDRTVSTIVTSVLVDRDDPAFDNPTKPIGPYFEEADAQAHIRRDGWHMVRISNLGWRRVVPSPQPRRVLEMPLIRSLFDEGHLLVVCGGGGIPVIESPDHQIKGTEAVIDKDLSAALLGLRVGADVLAMLTDQPCVYTDFSKPTQQALDRLTAEQARQLLDTGQFPAGSMGPKIQAAVDFVEQSANPKPRALITDCQNVASALDARAGTWIHRNDQPPTP